jgi:hypothetical protein
MKLYPSIGVGLTFQSCGSGWLGILRGPTEQIELAFNGLYNLRGTNGKLEYQDHLRMVATFWTNERNMRRFFFNYFYLPRSASRHGEGRLIRNAMRYAQKSLMQVKEEFESFMRFASGNVPECYLFGSITAERPDTDFKSAVLEHAFQNKCEGKCDVPKSMVDTSELSV